jgi:hypothetical protein
MLPMKGEVWRLPLAGDLSKPNKDRVASKQLIINTVFLLLAVPEKAVTIFSSLKAADRYRAHGSSLSW